jgi:Na+-translocating ferredoxin:NAD+ oxidoreductase RnfC subunit
VHTLDPIYPNDAPVLIVKKTLGLDVAYGQNTAEIGVVILEPQTVIGLVEHYIQKNELGTHLVPISGTGLRENKILRVKPGTPLQKILAGNVREDMKCRVFVNGPLNGAEVKDSTQKIDWSTRNIVVLEEKDYKIPFNYARVDELLFTTSLMGELRRCIYCNYCDDICPVGLEPALYWHCYIRGEKQKARLYALEKCIECGLCSFICPSKLELLQVIKECKSLK